MPIAQPSSSSVLQWRLLADALLSTDPRRRIRIAQWLISALVYLSTVSVLWFGALQGRDQREDLVYWACFVFLGEALFYAALRSGWSERFADPALTGAQILFGVLSVNWGYLICGPIRSVALLPLPLIFAFGAFSLGWRRIMQLTAVALASLLATILVLHSTRDGAAWSLDHVDLRLDTTNFLMVMILLPALSLVAARLSELRSKLRSQREALTAALQEVERLATHDELTGLANRRHAQARLSQEQKRFVRTGRAFSVAIIDIDHFKSINDRLGHAGGDEVLKEFAHVAASTLRECDLLARWGGEEFLVIFPDTGGVDAQVSLQRLLEHMRSRPDEAGAALSFSAGIAEYVAGDTLAGAISRADAGMYSAKHAGRDRVVLTSAAPDRQLPGRMAHRTTSATAPAPASER